MSRVVLLLLLALVALPSFGHAQIVPLDQFQRTVNRELRRYEEEFDVSDLTHEIWMGELRDEESRSLSIRLEANVEYLILGVCDEDCSDIDLVLKRGGSTIDEDVATDDYPIVSVTPGKAEDYQLEVKMVACSANPCRYGVAVYAQ
jgi:hypothetical protein